MLTMEQEGYALPRSHERSLQLTQLRDWCMERLSHLSCDGHHCDSRSLTAEFLEMLEQVDARRTLWMKIEPGHGRQQH